MEGKELQKFYEDIQEDINSALISEEEGNNPEQIFTELALSLLSESGETENYRVCFDEKLNKRGVEHKINGFALYENYETLDLFVTIYNSDSKVSSINRTDAEKALDRATKFFRNAVYKDYVNQIEESSEIFDLAHTLANVPEVKEYLTRVNVFLITNGIYKLDVKATETISGFSIFYRVIDLNYLFNLSDQSRVPIEIDFYESGYKIPCIANDVENAEYQSWLAIFPGLALADIYEKYGARLLEQNVRSFLQFTGKINKGIRNTLLKEQDMFMAFNNGIAATAEQIEVVDLPNNSGKSIRIVKDFQIVNGGQTTASIYHTWKKDKVDLSKIFVPVKLTIIKNRENFSDIVGRIAEYANTQNKVSISDLSSNRENHVLLEKLSRTTWAPPIKGESIQTRWFFERSRGQYKNERIRFGLTPNKRKQFDKQNPRNQMFTKELIAKYVNSFSEVSLGKKLVVGPHIVVRGNQKNYSNFLNYNFSSKPDNIWFEDAIAKSILFMTCEKLYGIKPNSIGDMRYITVPYSIGWLVFSLDGQLDLYKIWKNQCLSDPLKSKLYEVMTVVETFIKTNAPGSLFGEWAKKEECWNQLKSANLNIDLSEIKGDLVSKSSEKRKKFTEEEIDKAENEIIERRLRSVPQKIWKTIEEWGKVSSLLTSNQIDIAYSIGSKVQHKRELSNLERVTGDIILDKVLEHQSSIFFDLEEMDENTKIVSNESELIDLELIEKMVKWDRKNKRLKPYRFELLADLLAGRKPLTERNKEFVKLNLITLEKWGFNR